MELEKSFASEHPDIALEWHPCKNGQLSPNCVAPKSGKIVWWLGKCGHEWQSKVYSRANGSGCPYCSNNRVLAGYNDLATKSPELALEWHPTKNGDLRPTMVTPTSNKRVWWLGSCGHEWQAIIESRFYGNGCPVCANQRIVKGLNDLATVNPELAQEWHPIKNGELQPSMVSPKSDKKVWWLGKCGHEWQSAISHRANDRGCPFCSNKRVLVGFNDLMTTEPDLAREWNQAKNGNLKPSMVTVGSNKRVWWICKKGHEWQALVKERAKGTNCPICSNRQIVVGYNDLSSTNPDLAQEWHPTKNVNITPCMVTAGSKKRVWWLGSCGHEWESTVVNRVRGYGCPICANQQVIPGINDLATLIPALAKEWHPFKNESLRPSMVAPKSNKRVWWMCSRGHEWKALVSSRANGNGCPVCKRELHSSFPEQALLYYIRQLYPDTENSNKTAIGMELDIYIPSQRLAIEYDGRAWHRNNQTESKKNELCKLNDIKLIRVREAGLEHYSECICITRNDINIQSSLNDVINQVIREINSDNNADIDVDRDETEIYDLYILSQKKTSLEALYPDIAKEWHPTKNGSITPSMVMPRSSKKFWWMCNRGHEWKALVSSRTGGRGCPICANKLILKGYNDLESQNPELAKEWHPVKNGNLAPSMIAPKSSRKVWWLGKCGHEWQATVNDRANGTGCPVCRKKIRK